MTLKDFEDRMRGAEWSWVYVEALALLDDMRQREKRDRQSAPRRTTGHRRMTPDIAAEVVRLHKTTDLTQHAIASALNVNQGRVNEVVKRGRHLAA